MALDGECSCGVAELGHILRGGDTVAYHIADGQISPSSREGDTSYQSPPIILAGPDCRYDIPISRPAMTAAIFGMTARCRTAAIACSSA